MTTSFITNQQNKELSIDELKSVSGGSPAVFFAMGALTVLVTDFSLHAATGKGLSSHVVEGLYEMIDDAVEDGGATGDTDVVEKGS